MVDITKYLIIISTVFLLGIKCFAQEKSTINVNCDFILDVKIKDTLQFEVKYSYENKFVEAFLLTISVDSIRHVYNTKIYNTATEIKKTKYLLIPKTVRLQSNSITISTGNQYQKEYFYFLKEIKETQLDLVVTKHVDSPIGLISKYRNPLFWKIWYNIINKPIVERKHWKEVDKNKDDILRYIKRYEKAANQNSNN